MNDNTTYGIKCQIYTKESMHKYLDEVANAIYKGWKREEGIQGSNGKPWVSYQNSTGTWMHHYILKDDDTMTMWQFNPNQEINLVGTSQ